MTTATPNEQILGTLEHLHPDTVQLDDNVRTEAALTKPFVASIAEHGVLVPVTAVRTADGVTHVRTGQRRTLAARQAGLSTIPVFVRDVDYHPGDPSDEQQAGRLVEQIVENDRRLDLTPTQRVLGIQQLLDTGMSVTKAAKKLSVSAPTVKAAKAVAGSQAALDVLASDEHQLSLLEAAVIAEFEDDPRAVERLLNPRWQQSFDHVAAQLREERASAQAQADAEQRYRDEGYTVLTETPRGFDPFCVPLHSLLRADGEEADTTAVTVAAQWAVLVVEDQVLTDKETGERVDEDDVDWNTEGRPDATPETPEGETEPLRHADTVLETTGFGAEYFCLDYQGAGLTPNERFMRLGGVNRFPTEAESEQSDDGAPATADELAERRALAAAQAASEKEEADRRERRKVLALNKLGAAALEVRREFINKMLARKTAPKGAAIFVARALASDSYLLTTNNAANVAAELLALKGSGKKEAKASYEYAPPTDAVSKAVAALPDTGDQRAAVLTLGLVLGALEARTPKDAWRGATGYTRTGAVGGREYLQFLADNGYQLAPVEEVIAGRKKADKVYDQHVAEAS